MKIIFETNQEAHLMIHGSIFEKPLMLSSEYIFSDFYLNDAGQLCVEAHEIAVMPDETDE